MNSCCPWRRWLLTVVAFLMVGTVGSLALVGSPSAAHDWPMFGGTPQRNMVNTTDKNIPIEWSIKEGEQKNIKWTAQLGTRGYGSPVVASGKVFVGTNNMEPRHPKDKGEKALL